MEIWQQKGIFEFQISLRTGENIELRVEIFFNKNNYKFRCYRYDLFRLEVFSSADCISEVEKKSDCDLLIVDPMFDGFQTEARSANNAMQIFLDQLSQRLGVQISL